MPTPPIEPSSPASGIARRTRSPMNDMMSLNTPINTIVAMPTCHARIAASASGIRAFATMNAGPSTVSAMPIVDGASSPSGIAVTSDAARAPRETNRHHRVHDVAEHHAERRAGEHARVDERGRKAEAGDENSREHGEIHDVVEHQAEEGVDVALRRPLVRAPAR